MSETFGNRLRALRKKSGLTQEELAEAIGVHLNSVSLWENGEYTPKTQSIKALAKALGVSEADLLNDSPPDNSGRWVLSITVRQELKEEVIDLAKPIPEISTVVTANTGAYIALGGNYDLWASNEGFASIVKELKKLRDGVLQQGRARGFIPDENNKKRR